MEKRLIDVLKSKRFWVLVIGIAVMLLVAVEPRFASAESQLLNNILYLVLAAIGGYSAQDIILAWLAQPGNVTVAGQVFQSGVDEVERFFKVEIPDTIEDATRREAEKQLQAFVDNLIRSGKTAP